MSQYKTVCTIDQENLFIGTDTADADPLEPGMWLIPAGCIDAPVPDIPAGHAARWLGEGWQYL
ncbi:hypothetical protein L1281_002256, partial [Neisseria sp. HSC-16F19]|nr:hypothetical protein [Neisseria sp. HSC-16F19]